MKTRIPYAGLFGVLIATPVLMCLALFVLASSLSAQTSGQSSIPRKKPFPGSTGSDNGSVLENFTIANGQLVGRTSAGTLSSIQLGTGLTMTGTTINAVATGGAQDSFLLNDLVDDTLDPEDTGLGWADDRLTLQSPAGVLQMYEAGDPLESVLYYPGRIIAGALESTSITGNITGEQVASGILNNGVLTNSMTRPMLHWQNSATFAGTNGLTYAATGPGGQTEPQNPAMYFAGIEVVDGDPDANYLQGRIRSASQVRSDLGLVIGTNVLAYTAPGTSGNVLTSNGSAWVSSAPAGGGGGGKVLQMVYATKTDTTTGTQATPTSVFSATITPTSATSRIVVHFTGVGSVTGGWVGWVNIARGSTALNLADAAGSRTRTALTYGYPNAAYALVPLSVIAVDEPATTSATTYSVQFSVESGGTYYVNRSTGDVNSISYPRGSSTLMIMEVAP